MNLRELIMGIIAFLLLPSVSIAQCSAPANQQIKPFHGSEDSPSGHFEWYSAAAPNPTQGGGHPSHVFERRVQNMASTTLKYSWPIGRMHNDALPAGKTDSFCYEYQWPNQADGPLHYGRGNNETQTSVWEGKDEPKVTEIWATFSFNIENAGGTQIVSVRVRSSLRRATAGKFSYDYSFESVNGTPVKLQWGVQKDKTLLDNLSIEQMSAVFSVEGKRGLSFDSGEIPTVGFRTVSVVIDGKGVAGVEVPMFIPGKSLWSKKSM